MHLIFAIDPLPSFWPQREAEKIRRLLIFFLVRSVLYERTCAGIQWMKYAKWYHIEFVTKFTHESNLYFTHGKSNLRSYLWVFNRNFIFGVCIVPINKWTNRLIYAWFCAEESIFFLCIFKVQASGLKIECFPNFLLLL